MSKHYFVQRVNDGFDGAGKYICNMLVSSRGENKGNGNSIVPIAEMVLVFIKAG